MWPCIANENTLNQKLVSASFSEVITKIPNWMANIPSRQRAGAS